MKAWLAPLLVGTVVMSGCANSAPDPSSQSNPPTPAATSAEASIQPLDEESSSVPTSQDKTPTLAPDVRLTFVTDIGGRVSGVYSATSIGVSSTGSYLSFIRVRRRIEDEFPPEVVLLDTSGESIVSSSPLQGAELGFSTALVGPDGTVFAVAQQNAAPDYPNFLARIDAGDSAANDLVDVDDLSYWLLPIDDQSLLVYGDAQMERVDMKALEVTGTLPAIADYVALCQDGSARGFSSETNSLEVLDLRNMSVLERYSLPDFNFRPAQKVSMNGECSVVAQNDGQQLATLATDEMKWSRGLPHTGVFESLAPSTATPIFDPVTGLVVWYGALESQDAIGVMFLDPLTLDVLSFQPVPELERMRASHFVSHLIMSPNGGRLFAQLNESGNVAEKDRIGDKIAAFEIIRAQ